jgi:hypothetical protein
MKYWEYWDNLQLMPDGPLPANAKRYTADKDTAYSVLVGDVEEIYCDGSDKFREWIENLLAWPTRFYVMFYSYANVVREMVPQILNKTKDTTNKARIIAHSRGIFGLGVALKLYDLGWEIEEVILYGAPNPGMWRFAKECEKRGIKITFIVVKGDWVIKRPIFGKHPEPQRYILLKNIDNLKGIKKIHLSYGRYCKRLNL